MVASNTQSADFYIDGVYVGTANSYPNAGIIDKFTIGNDSYYGIGDEYYIDNVIFSDK